MRALPLLAVSAAIAGCAATAPLSFLSGQPQSRAELHLYPVRIVSVDGEIHFNRPADRLNVAPGLRWLVVDAPPPRQGARTSVQKSGAFRVEPCTHYWLAARRDSAMAADWTLVVDRQERVAGCDPAEELRKASRAPGSGPAASAAR